MSTDPVHQPPFDDAAIEAVIQQAARRLAALAPEFQILVVWPKPAGEIVPNRAGGASSGGWPTFSTAAGGRSSGTRSAAKAASCDTVQEPNEARSARSRGADRWTFVHAQPDAQADNLIDSARTPAPACAAVLSNAAGAWFTVASVSIGNDPGGVRVLKAGRAYRVRPDTAASDRARSGQGAPAEPASVVNIENS
jgi:hypothetical protein